MLLERLARALRPLTLGAALLAGPGCGDPGETIEEEVETDADALEVGELPPRFGAAGILFQERIGPVWPQVPDPTNGASQSVFHDLKAAGAKHVRQAASLSFDRGYHTIPMDVTAAQREGIDLFIMVHLGHCQNPVPPTDVGNPSKDHGCSDVMSGSVEEGAAAFKERFRTLYMQANPNGQKNVTTWSINEPDLDMNEIADGPDRAAAFYAVAREVLVEMDCASQCRLVAGELSRYNAGWFKRYVKGLKKRGMNPSRFAIHPYGDVNRATPKNWSTVHPSTTASYVKAVKKAFPKAKVWLTEVGRMLHRDKPGDHFCVSSPCGWAAGRFVRRLAKWPGVTRVYWWDMASSQKGGWDSALADHDGNRRAMFYGLLGHSKKTALEKAKGSDPHPWR